MGNMLSINHDKLCGERALLKDDQPNIPRIEKDLLRIRIVNTVGNFKSTPCQMGDNLAGDEIKYCSEPNTVGHEGISIRRQTLPGNTRDKTLNGDLSKLLGML